MRNKILLKYLMLLTLYFTPLYTLKAQTFFETAKDDGIISFAKEKTSQIKVNVASTAITYGFNYVSGNATKKTRLLFNAEVKAKPNDDGLATLIKSGDLEPGLKVNAALGVRLVHTSPFFSAFDIYLKPSYEINNYTVYDTLRSNVGLDPVFKKNKNSFGLNGLINGVIAPGRVNLFFGIQYGINWTNNGEDLDKGTIQTIEPYAGSPAQSVITNQKEITYGHLENLNKSPLKIDLIFDPGIKINRADATNIYLGFFGYYRTDGKEHKYRSGFGICFLDATNPSRIFTSLGYEVPQFGSDIKPDARAKDKGSIFFTIGYSIF